MSDAVEAAKALCAAVPSAVAFALLPMLHSSTDCATITTKRRNVEDMMMARFGSCLVSFLKLK